MITFAKSRAGILVTDFAIFLTLYLLPGISHLLPVPLYLFEPMRIAVLTAYLLNRNFPNAFILALTIPVFSTITAGHPVLLKALLISAELAVNIAMLHWLLVKIRFNPYLSIFLSVLSSKVIYYFAKFAVLSLGMMSGSLFSTDLRPQLMLSIGLALIFGFLFRRKE